MPRMSTLRESSLRLRPDAAERELMKAARRLARLQAVRRALLQRLRTVVAEIRTAKQELRALVQDVSGRDTFDQAPPLREFGESQLDK